MKTAFTRASACAVRKTLRADLFCERFEGGGHAAAAGCRINGNFEAAVEKITNNARASVGERHPPVE